MKSNFELMQHISHHVNDTDRGLITSTEAINQIMDLLDRERGDKAFASRLGIRPEAVAIDESNVVLGCAACDRPSEVVLYAHRFATNEMRQVFVCKGHMLDPGPLLDW